MIARLQEVNPFPAHPMDETVLLRDTPGAHAGQQVPQRLGLADACERGFDQFENA